MKKAILLVLALLLCGGTVGSIYFLTDNKSPKIIINSKPKVGCSIEIDDLLQYAGASDENLESFFVEEKDIYDILENKYVTYVAIDSSNNITKQRTSVEFTPDITTYHIEEIKPFNVQLNSKPETSDYFAVKNECGWNVKEDISIDGAKYSTEGSYDVKVYVKKDDSISPIYTKLVVADYKAPRIYLKEGTGYEYSYKKFDDNYFLDLIDYIEDDKDDPDELVKLMNINWEEVLQPGEDGFVDKTGTFTITYKLIDSEGNVGTKTYKLILE